MRHLSCIALILSIGATGMAQEAFEADTLFPCLDGSALVATCSPDLLDSRLRLVSALDWADRLLRLRDPSGEDSWLVRRRLNLRLAASWAPTTSLRLTLGLDGTPRQHGQGTDAAGAPQTRGPDLGRTSLTALWIPLPDPAAALAWGLVSRLVYPLGAPDSLTGPGDLRWQGEIWLSARTPWLQPHANLGLALGESQRYRNLTRDQALLARLGLVFGQPDWPWTAGVEAVAQTRLQAPLAQRVNSPLEILFSLHFKGLDWMQGHLVAGLGALGPSVPRFRLGLVLEWPCGRKKRTSGSE